MVEKDFDIILFHSLKAGNEEALDLLFKKYYSPLCQYTQVFLSDRPYCEDVVSELFADIWIKRSKLEIKHNFKAYIYRSAKNAALAYKRKKKLETVGFDEIEKFDVASSQSVYSKYSIEHTLQKIQKIMESIPPRSREVFMLSRFEEMKYKEISAILGISVKTVENHMGKALKTIHKHQNFLIKIIGVMFMFNVLCC